ncbi:hypothetical protein BB560_007229 [Smittium megazygosporum]|uniref:Uncharacterized protein n=1 Tax=Smittium megazygosporum TaxID=133381 RepID=A0A2T9XXU7_9FUNG|nr:hypothetical protein BB560_007229 [Smittium megazygosporum]
MHNAEKLQNISKFKQAFQQVKKYITGDLKLSQPKKELHDKKEFIYVFKNGKNTCKLNTKHTRQTPEINTKTHNNTETKNKIRTVSIINQKTNTENPELQKTSHDLNKVGKTYIQNLHIKNTGINPETKLNALNEAQKS